MYQDDELANRRSWVKTLALWGVAVALMVGVVLLLMQYLAKPASKPRGVQQVALIKQPPPPPPPKPPEKVPEPPKVKEEVKIDEPKDEPKPDEPKPADEKPPAGEQLKVDADGAAGSDGFGLGATRSGRDLLSTGGGGGAYYTGLLQRQFLETLTRNRKFPRDQFRVVVRVLIGDDGRVQRADIVNGTGNAQTDDLIQATLLEMNPLKDIPPSSMRSFQMRLSNA
ncbi:MAG: energy transducer TonB [Rhizobacter sp.]|nr:energy transducer TonB [Rhizobacter sp.]